VLSELPADVRARARRIRLMIFDVDGVLTDGRLWYGPDGEALKAFHSFDGQGIKMLQHAGILTALLSGRKSDAVTRRAAELGIPHVLQGIEDKGSAFGSLLQELSLEPVAAGYMGDDVIDLPVLRRCGFACVPREAPEWVRRHAHYVPKASAGLGAAREVCDLLLEAQDALAPALAAYLAK